MFESIPANGRAPRWSPSYAAGIALVGTSLALAAGCNSFAARGKNAEGVRLFQQAHYEEALRDFQQATYTDPGDPDGYYNLAATYHRLGTTGKQQSYLDQAEKYYNMCLDRDKDHRQCYRGLAVLLAEQGRNEQAFRLIEGWVDQEPNSADARIELARLHEEFDNREAAKERLVEALKIDPRNARAFAALGKIREETGKPVEALRNYQRALGCDRFQPQVASRVAALQTATISAPLTPAPDGGTRLVEKGAATLR